VGLVFPLSAFTAAHGMNSGGLFCTDDSCKLYVVVSLKEDFLHDRVVSPVQTLYVWKTGRLLFVWPLNFDLSDMEDPTRTSRGPASKALRLIEARKPPPSGSGSSFSTPEKELQKLSL